MEEGCKLWLMAAAILGARKVTQYEGGKQVPATVAAMSNAVRWAEEIMRANGGPTRSDGLNVAAGNIRRTNTSLDHRPA